MGRSIGVGLRLIGVGFLLLSACYPSAGQLFAQAKVLKISIGAEPKDLDPHIVTGVPEHRVLVSLFEGLVTVHPKTLEPMPAVAESWTVSKDQRVYTFKIRKSARWSNGDPVTADDFVYSWQRLLAPKTASQYAYQGYYIKNGKAFNSGEIKDPAKLGVKSLDSHTLQVTLENPTPFFLGLLYHYSLYPVHRKTVEKFGSQWTRPGKMVSNGPFILKEWTINKQISVARNANYWDAQTVKLDGVDYLPISNRQTEENMFRAHRLHVTNSVPIEKLPFWQRDQRGLYQQHPYIGTYYYRFNTTRKPLNDKRVRKALSLTIDRTKLVKFVTRAGQIPGTVFTPPGTANFHPTPKLPETVTPESIAQARALLKEAGYPDGKGMRPLEILYNSDEGHKKIAEAIQQMWKTNLGIEVKLFNQEWKAYLANTRTMNYDISRAGWIGDYNDPNTFLDMWVKDGGNNETGWHHPEYDQLIAAAAKTPDGERRLSLFQRAEDLLLEELPIMPIYIYTRVYLKSPVVKGWYANVQDYHPLKFLSLD